jgi:hypothetical protein
MPDLEREFNLVVYPTEEFQKKARENHHFLTEVINGSRKEIKFPLTLTLSPIGGEGIKL